MEVENVDRKFSFDVFLNKVQIAYIYIGIRALKDVKNFQRSSWSTNCLSYGRVCLIIAVFEEAACLYIRQEPV